VEVLNVIRYSGGSGKSKPNTPTTGRSGCSSDTASLASQHCATCDPPRGLRTHDQAMRDLEEEEDEGPRQRQDKPINSRTRHRSSSSRLGANNAAAFARTDPSGAMVLGSRRSSAPEIDQDSTAEEEVDLPPVGPTFTRSLERTRLGQNNNSARSSDSEATPATRVAASPPHRRRNLERAAAQVQDCLGLPPTGAGRTGVQRTEAAERTEIKAVVHRAEACKTSSAESAYPLASTPPPITQQKRYSGMNR